tara:strand:- start:679 stop:1530 length:852 start_codon:yes stop_codon:yes gene_type:complete
MILEHSHIVVGSSLEAVLFAYTNGYPLFFAAPIRPFRFDFIQPKYSLLSLKLQNKTNVLNTFEEHKSVGIPKDVLWERLLFIMSLMGLVPLSDMCNSIRHDDTMITCFNEYSKIAEIRYEKMYNFKQDDKTSSVFCCDWIAFNSGGKHGVDFISTPDKFVNEIWFYPSDRICGNTKVKDVCAVSIIDADLIDDFEFSQTMARFKVVKEMKQRGMKGLLSSYGPNGNPKHYDFKTSVTARTVMPASFTKCYDQHDIVVQTPTPESMIKQLSRSSQRYWKVLRYL